jgi:hypothetical protein
MAGCEGIADTRAYLLPFFAVLYTTNSRREVSSTTRNHSGTTLLQMTPAEGKASWTVKQGFWS